MGEQGKAGGKLLKDGPDFFFIVRRCLYQTAQDFFVRQGAPVIFLPGGVQEYGLSEKDCCFRRKMKAVKLFFPFKSDQNSSNIKDNRIDHGNLLILSVLAGIVFFILSV